MPPPPPTNTHTHTHTVGATCYSGRGRGYNGTLNVTLSEYPCQSWNSTFPHRHLLHLGDYPELEGGHNFCRNPGERGEKPWCFTTNRDTRWEYCGVPKCREFSTVDSNLYLLTFKDNTQYFKLTDPLLCT